jgi:hypothetical protein
MTPFSFYVLAPYIRKAHPEISIICDLSDPFINNGANKYWLPFWKLKILKFEGKCLRGVNKLVVLNPVIKRMYAGI